MVGKKVTGFMSFLAVVSILGFLVVVLDSFANLDISSWVSGLIFIVIGVGLGVVGSFWSVVEFSDGLSNTEVAHILTTIIGFLAVVVGFFSLPWVFLEGVVIPGFDGVRGLIGLFAIVLIVIEAWFVRRNVGGVRR